MPRYRNNGSMPLNYSDSGGPWVEPGAEFDHEIPPAQRASHLHSGFISVVESTVSTEPPAADPQTVSDPGEPGDVPGPVLDASTT